MIYRVCMRNYDGSQGFVYFSSKRDALRYANSWIKEERKLGDVEMASQVDAGVDDHLPTPKNKAQIIEMLNYWGSHNDNG